MMDLLRFPDTSRVWIYTSSREFRDDELHDLQAYVNDFVRQWTSHNQSLHATGGILHNRFLVLVVDESLAGASGCSIDSSVHFIRELGSRYNTDFFDRTTFCFLDGDEVKAVPMSDLKSAYNNGDIRAQTLFFDTLVNNKGEFIQAWLKPVANSWLARLLR